jgi:hypothetical protein
MDMMVLLNTSLYSSYREYVLSPFLICKSDKWNICERGIDCYYISYLLYKLLEESFFYIVFGAYERTAMKRNGYILVILKEK